MFQKPAFGSNTTGFGSFNAGASTSSPFGGFKPTTATSAFGAPPAFGAATSTQPASGGLFGSTNTTGGLFGSSTASTSTPAFGATTSGFGGFGGNTSTGGLFGSTNTPTTGLFGANQNTSAFGAKPSFGFGATTPSGTAGTLFGAAQPQSSGLFGQPSTNMSGGTMFANTAGGFGGQQQQVSGTAHVKYNPVVGTDMVVKSGNSQNVNIKHHCITCMKEYEGKSLEELRMEDYSMGRKGATGGMFGGFQQQQQEHKPLFSATNNNNNGQYGGKSLEELRMEDYSMGRKGATGGMFGGFQQQQQEHKPLFSATNNNNNAFGQPATTSAPSVFGGGGLGATTGFGQTNAFSFGGNTQANTNTGNLFGASKPAFGATSTAGTGLFGTTTTQAAPSFGTSTNAFGFGGSNTQPQGGGLFGSPATSTGAFGAVPSFGGFGGASGGLFGSKQATAAPAANAAPAFGAPSTGFGANTSTTGGLFGGGNTFKPPTSTPSFGFNTTPALGGGLGTGLGTSFQAKPVGNAFNMSGGGLFSQNNNQNATFKTGGLDGGLGGGLFSNNNALGNTMSGLGNFNTNNNTLNNTNMTGASAGGNVHEQILSLVARPYGDSPLFKDLLPDSSTTSEDVLKPTNPIAVKAVLNNFSNQYRVNSPPTDGIKLQPRARAADKKSLFDGLEEADASLEDKLSLKPSRKRLVLRPKKNDSVELSYDNANHTNRSIEEQPNPVASQERAREKETLNNIDPKERDRVKRSIPEFNENGSTNIDITSDRHESWLTSPTAPWSSEREQAIGSDPTPRLYPNLDRELPNEISERRASWLTTKPLRKPSLGNPDSAENSVRDLGLRSSDRIVHDKENIDNLSVSEEENVQPRESPPHPTGVVLTRPGYYSIPSLDDMINYLKPDGTCVVPHLTIGRKNYGNVYYDCSIDVAGMDLDTLVHFLNKEVIIYPDDAEKPPVGEGLNRRAIVTLDRIWPRDKTERRHITEPNRLLKMDYEGKLRRVCEKHDTKFIEYRPQTGSWVFRVEHFSKYGLTDSDEEEDITPEVMKRQIINQSLQKAAAPASKQPVALPVGLGGLGGLGPDHLSNLSPDLSNNLSTINQHNQLFGVHENTMFLNGSKAFEMDITEDNNEGQSLYQDSNRAYGVKSPTSELARLENRQSHNVQLMKASLYVDTEMSDDGSISSDEQLVPASVTSHLSSSALQVSADVVRHSDIIQADVGYKQSAEIKMRPLVVNPPTIVLKYHRKIPPFKKTIAGRLDAACLADMSVCRARHSRVGFGPSSNMTYVTTSDNVNGLPKSSDLSELGRYTIGRSESDWSEPMVVNMALGETENNSYIQQVLTQQLSTILDFTEPNLPNDEESCNQAVIRSSPTARVSLLRKLIRDADKYVCPNFGVSGSYCLEVFKLCEALWGLDLENDGIPGTDEQSIVNRHRRLIDWIGSAVAETTDTELKTTNKAVDDDEDAHSPTVWTLMLGGRVLEACKLYKQHGDLNIAVIIAQAAIAGDQTFRSLISRQLAVWRECGADAFISRHRLATLQLVAGENKPKDKFLHVDWLRTFYATARYLCQQIPSLEQIIRTYESLIRKSKAGDEGDDDDEMADIGEVMDDELELEFPHPPYVKQYHLSVQKDGQKRRIKDLRYELLRSRAYNLRPKLHPPMYTPDHTDYSLSFILDLWFGNPSIDNICGCAQQLEAAGLWHLSIQVLMHHADDRARGHLVRGVVSRHATDDEKYTSFLQRLGVPKKWVLEAQAHRAKYMRQPLKEAEFLVGAGQWNAAHKVLVEELLPDAVLSDNLQSVVDIVDKLQAAYEKDQVSGWDSGGMALYHYIHVQEEIRGLVNKADTSDRSEVQVQLEALRPRVLAASRALANLKTKSVSSLAAVTEMGARLVSLSAAAGADCSTLTHTLAALQLPTHTTAQLTHKITQEIAEQASEMCIESSNSSPNSSQQRH